jgi:predicted nucleic acid-binding protein
MNSVLVDSNVILDIATNDPRWLAWSRAALARLAEKTILVVNPVIFAEVSTHYDTFEEVDEILPPLAFRREPIPYEAAFLAAKAFAAYRRRGGQRSSPLPDFFIGAHAAVARYRLLTRDAARYRSYFPTVELIAP